MDRNGYFVLENRDDATYLSQVMPEGSGKPATLEALVSYLDKKHIPSPDMSLLKNFVEQTTDGKSVRFLPTQTIPFAGWCEYSVAANGLSAQLIMYPPMKGMPDVSVEEIANDIKTKGIIFGVNTDLLRAIISSKRYFENFIFAKGKPQRDGKDAVLTYHFNPEVDSTPTILENGTVDFHHLDNINHVEAGDVVASIEKEDPGDPGINVLGQEIKPKKVNKKTFKFGRNLTVSEDGLQLISNVSGHVTLEGDKIFVSDEYEVKVDVDTSTGDIDFNGNVRIRGAVRSGFKVNATGNITVDGVVEAAELRAGGDIIMARGVSGHGRAIIEAGGNVISTYIESANVRAGNRIESDSILHSEIYAAKQIEAKGRNGNIIGGHVNAGAMVIAKEIGSKMGTNTVVKIGSDAKLFEQMKQIQEAFDQKNMEKNKLTQIVEMLKVKLAQGALDAQKLQILKDATKNMLLITSELSKMQEELDQKKAMCCDPKDGRVKISGSIFQGVKLEFGADALFIRDENNHCQYVKKGADIVMVAL